MSSIRSRLSIILLTSVALLMGIGGTLVYLLIQSYFHLEFNERLRVQALSITSVIKQERKYIDVEFSDRYLREFREDKAEKFYQIWAPLPVDDDDAPKMKRSDSLTRHQNLPRKVGTLKAPLYWALTLPNGRPGRAIGIHYVPHADQHDRRRNFDPDLFIDLVVAEDSGELLAALATIRNSLFLVGAIGFIVTALIIQLVVRRELRTLDFVGDKAGSISADSLHLRFPVENMPQELMPICTRLNQLLGRLEGSFERERQFSSDISHELRTPIAELRSYAELNLKWPNQPVGKFPADALKIAEQMGSLVEELMLLSRCDQEQLPVSCAPFDLPVLLKESIQTYSSKATTRGLKVVCRSHVDLTLESDRALVVSIVNNLINNAVEYAPEGGDVVVECVHTPDHFTVSVTNAAPGLSPQDEPLLFDRFWRSDMARTSQEHFGLGLPLSRALAKRLGFTLTSRLANGALTISMSGYRI